MPRLPADPNPIGQLGAQIGSSIADLAAGAFNTAMKALWDFAVLLMGSVMGVIDHLATPNLDPRSGPLAAVLPATVWVGGVLLVVLSLLQVGKSALTGGAGLLHLLKGIAQYVVVTACALGVLTALVTAADAAALGILSSGLQVDSWAGIAAANSAWQNGVNAVSGAGLGLIALLGVLPAAIGLLVAALVREAAILVIAATIPILAAGLVAEATTRWFWTGLRWLLALVLLTPTVALTLTIGLKLAGGVAGGTAPANAATDAGQSAVAAFVGAGVLLISVFCPLALFKLFAFVDPATPSGQLLRTSMTPGASSGSPAGAGSSSAGTDGHDNATGEQVESRWSTALGQLSGAHRALAGAAQAAMSTAAPVLAAVGVGDGTDPEPAHARNASGRTSRPESADPGSDQPDSASPQPPPTPEIDPPRGNPPTPPIPPGPGDGPAGSGRSGSTGGTPGSSGAGGPGAGAGTAAGSEAAVMAP